MANIPLGRVLLGETNLETDTILTMRDILGEHPSPQILCDFFQGLQNPDQARIYNLGRDGYFASNGNKRIIAAHLAGANSVPEICLEVESPDNTIREIAFKNNKHVRDMHGVSRVGEFAKKFLSDHYL